MDEKELIHFLDQNNIKYQRFDHDAVYTCEESNRLLPDVPGARTKNLLLCDERKENWYFLMFLDHKKVDFKRLAKNMGVGKLSFAPPEKMMNILGIEPGSVTVFALANDPGRQVHVILDKDLWDYETWHAHPMINTATLDVPREGIEKFLVLTGHSFQVVEIPTRQAA
jgi:Ala-tRNA(Pro) deacylase